MITVGKSAQIADAIAGRQAEVVAYEVALIDAGMNWQGNVIQIDANSQSNMLATQVGFNIGQTAASGGGWRSKANVWVEMDDATVKAMILAAQAYVKGLMFNCWAHKDAIGKLTTLAAIEAYDFTTGWPDNNH